MLYICIICLCINIREINSTDNCKFSASSLLMSSLIKHERRKIKRIFYSNQQHLQINNRVGVCQAALKKKEEGILRQLELKS